MGGGTSAERAQRKEDAAEAKRLLAAKMHHESAFLNVNQRATSYHATTSFVKHNEENLNGYNTKVYADGSVYKGEYVRGHRHGRGVHTWENGDCYDGYWVNDRKHGICCRWTFPNGDEYEGETCEGHLGGSNSKMKYKNGDIYEGSFGYAGREGHGICTYSDRKTYSGFWHMDQPHGTGKYDWSACTYTREDSLPYKDYITYEGSVFGARLDGVGLLHFRNGDVYHGDMHADKISGLGTVKFQSHEDDILEYNGGWHDGQMNGSGTATYRNGTKWIGEFYSGKRHGLGSLYDSSGVLVEEGTWKENEGPQERLIAEATAARRKKEEQEVRDAVAAHFAELERKEEERKENERIAAERTAAAKARAKAAKEAEEKRIEEEKNAGKNAFLKKQQAIQDQKRKEALLQKVVG